MKVDYQFDLSVVIVNYNVKNFLEQALLSVRKASRNLNVETWVVDNNSVDGSVAMVMEKFPEVKVIANKQNFGFAKANNQAIVKSNGKYILLLNPDTVLAEDSFEKCYDFMEAQPDAGALGVRMIDGKGKFLPESKRGLPTPEVAFYKMFGLAAMFPKSKKFGKYHLKFLDEFEVNEVEILSGAYMFIRKEALEKAGVLDETFFMYGEDIDLSYRLIKAGYKNFYFPKTTIIHYKGESTKKHSVNYVKVFYKAMVIFARKHYKTSLAGLFALLVYFAIYIRASLSLLRRFVLALLPVMGDFLVFFTVYYFITKYWEDHNKWVDGGEYPAVYFWTHLPFYSLVLIIGFWLARAYKFYFSPSAIKKGMLTGGLLLLVGYALLPYEFRYSRAILILGILLGFIGIYLFRSLVQFVFSRKILLSDFIGRKVLLVGSTDECERASKLLNNTIAGVKVIGWVNPKEEISTQFIGNIDQFPEILAIYEPNEIIFCGKDVSSSKIMEIMVMEEAGEVSMKIMPEESNFIIGSDSKNQSGEFYSLEYKLALASPYVRRKKRFFDLVMSMMMFPLIPFLNMKNGPLKGKALNEWYGVLTGKKTWIGYSKEIDISKLPSIPPGVVGVEAAYKLKLADTNLIAKINTLYAGRYKVVKDFALFFRSFF